MKRSDTFRRRSTRASQMDWNRVFTEKLRTRQRRAPGDEPAPMDPEETELYEWLLDPVDGATVYEFVAFFLVKTEAATYQPFVLRDRQRDIIDLILEAWARGEVAKLIVLKTRRYGISTLILILTLERVLRVPGWEGAPIAKDKADARYFLSKAREFVNQIPAEALAACGIVSITESREELAYRHGEFKESRIRVMTANTRGLGRGATINGLHPTEMPHWARKAKEDYQAIQPALGDFPGNWEIWESTACGFEEFQAQFEAARWPGDKAKDSKFVRVFIGWHEHPDSTEQILDEDVEEFERSLGKDSKYGGPEELTLLKQTLLPYNGHARRAALEQLKWRRITITDKCKVGGLNQFHQEYPTTPEEAFVSTGTPFFYLPQIRSWIPIARVQQELAIRGNFVVKGEKVVWTPGVGGMWAMLSDRAPGQIYCHANDTASGRRVHADGKREADFPITMIDNAFSGHTVAQLRRHLRPREHAWECLKASIYYGKARGYTERSVTGDEGTTLARLQDLQIGDTYGDEICERSVQFVHDLKGRRSAEEIIGLLTRRGTKRPLLDAMRDYLETEMGEPPDPVEGENDVEYARRAARLKPCPLTWETLSEALYFEETQSSESGHVKIAASRGHDDCVMAKAIALRAREVVLEDPDKSSPIPEELDPEVALHQARWANQTETRSGATPLGGGY